MDRIAQLRAFIAQSPQDAFPRYALGLELKGAQDMEGAARELTELLRLQPDYLAAYLQLGMVLQALGQPGEARTIFARGQEVARAQGNAHTLSELTAALESL